MRNSNSRSDESGGFGEGSLPPAGSLRSTAARASRARQRGLLCCAFAATAIPLPTRADDYYFQPTSGSSPWNWDSSISPYFSWRNNTLGINADSPTNGANAYLIQSGALGIANATVLFNYAYSGPGLTSLQIDSKNALMQSDPSSAMIVSSVEYIGYLGNGSYTQSGGANTAGDFVGIGFLVGATGAYNQTGGTLTTGGLAIGNQGTGVFNQSGKSINSVLGTTGVPGLYVGLGPAGNGTYNLSDSATLNVVASEFIGYQGTGVFNQSGGINTLGFRGLTVGSGSTGNGTYALSGGNLVLPIAFEVIGLFGNGTFIQSGGTHTINGGTLSVGQSGGGSGT